MSLDPRRQLRAFKKSSGLPVAEVARRLGISRQHYYRLVDDDDGDFPGPELEDRIHRVAGIDPAAWGALRRRQARNKRVA